MLVLLDAKRGDIGSTSEAYARAAYEAAGADALTASPYMGEDSMEPLLRNPKFGVFMLCRTSNPGSKDIQARPAALIPLCCVQFFLVENEDEELDEETVVGLER